MPGMKAYRTRATGEKGTAEDLPAGPLTASLPAIPTKVGVRADSTELGKELAPAHGLPSSSRP